MNRLHRLLLDPLGDEGGAAAPAEGKVDRQANNVADPVERFQRLLEKHKGDAAKLAMTLHRDNYKHRQEIKDLEAKLPPEGAVVLTKDDAALFQSYKALGGPEDLKSVLTERDRYKGEFEKSERRKFFARAGKDLNYDADVLERLAAQDGIRIEVKETTGRDGKKAPSYFALGWDEKDPEKPRELTDLAKERWAKFLPSLQTTAAKPPPGTPSRAQAAGAPPPIREAIAPLYGRNPFS